MSAVPLLNRITPRNATIAALTANLNGNLATFAGSGYYNQSAFEIDFTGESGNFAVADIENFDSSPIATFPALCVFTADDKDEGSPHGFRWIGPVLVAARFCIRFRTGVEAALATEVIFDWITDAFVSTINDPTIQWPAGVIYKREANIQKAKRLEQLGNGWQLIAEYAVPFQVAVTA